MLCMTDFARRAAGLESLSVSDRLASSAGGKARDILGCGEFSHFACGRPFYHWMGEAGYLSECWWVGENIAWGDGEYGTPGSIFRAWMRSETHRENILSDFAEIGVAVRTGALEGRSGVRVWVQHFGAHRCAGSTSAGSAPPQPTLESEPSSSRRRRATTRSARALKSRSPSS
jgi:uncharacterized protein YkwD